MANQAAYFQLDIKKDGTYLNLFPGEGGERPEFGEIDRYLNWKHIDYDKIAVMKVLKDFSEACSLRITPARVLEENESVMVSINEDHSRACGIFYPPSTKGQPMSREDIISDLDHAGVKYGMNEAEIDSFLTNRQYGRTYILAEYTPQVEGKSAVITYNFNTDPSRKPKLNEDGSVDFHKLDTLSAVHKGDCIATLTPAVLGKPGKDVTGRPIQPVTVKRLFLRRVKNTSISEDGCHLISDVDGYVSLISGTIFVSSNYEVPADVDASTGDIDFDGSVTVRGNVLTGFKVRAKGDIIVDGVVEGAEIYSGGQIILKRGIQGMGRGRLIADGNVISKFIENAEVDAGGYIETDAILHSRVRARGEVTATGKRGLVVGGEIHSGAGISVKTAGSTMGTNTVLEVGFDPMLMEEYHRIEERLPKMEAELDRLNKIYQALIKKMRSGGADTQETLQNVTQSKQALEQKIQESLDRMNELKEKAGDQSHGSIRVSGVIYPGCKVVLYNVTYHVRMEMKYCRLVKDRADVKMSTY